jgi:hypothetical protein
MSGGWGHITDEQGRYRGAGTMDTGGDVEEFAREMFGMVWWLGAQLAAQEVSAAAAPAVVREAALPWVRVAAENTPEGFELGGVPEGTEGH